MTKDNTLTFQEILKMKKILSILSIFILMFSLGACSKVENYDVIGTEKKYANDEEKAVCEVAESFLEAWRDWDFITLKNHITNPEELENYDWNTHLNTMIKEQIGGIPTEYSAYRQELQEAYTNLIARGRKELHYEIKQVEKVDNDTYTIAVSVTEADVVSAFQNQHMNDEQKLLEELKQSGKITDSMTEAEQNLIFIPENVKLFMEIADTVEFEATTKDKKLVVVKDGDVWLIDFDESDFKLV